MTLWTQALRITATTLGIGVGVGGILAGTIIILTPNPPLHTLLLLPLCTLSITLGILTWRRADTINPHGPL